MYKLHKYLLHYNFFISFCAVALVKYFAILAHQPVPAYIYILTFFATLFAYNLFRNYQSIGDYLANYFSLSSELITYSLILCVICYWLLPMPLKVFYVSPALLAMAYKFPLLGRANLRSAAFLKVFIIALVWVLVGAAVILYNQPDARHLEGLLPLVIAQFLFFVGITLPFDVFDIDKDHIKTFPTVFGAWQSMLMAGACLLAYCAIHLFDDNSLNEKIAHALVTLSALLVLVFYKKLKKSPLRYYLVDGLILLQTLIIYLLD